MNQHEEAKLKKIFESNFKKAWKAQIQEELENGNWMYFIDILKEILNRIYSLIPNRPDLHNKIDKEVPISLIQQMIENDAIQVKDFRLYFTSILGWLKVLGAPNDDKQIEETINRIELMTVESFSSAIPPVVLDINEKIDNIQQQIVNFKNETN